MATGSPVIDNSMIFLSNKNCQIRSYIMKRCVVVVKKILRPFSLSFSIICFHKCSNRLLLYTRVVKTNMTISHTIHFEGQLEKAIWRSKLVCLKKNQMWRTYCFRENLSPHSLFQKQFSILKLFFCILPDWQYFHNFYYICFRRLDLCIKECTITR